MEKNLPFAVCYFGVISFLFPASVESAFRVWRQGGEREKTHTDKREIKCEFCNILVKSKSGLRTHIIRKHEEPRHKCPFCDKAYAGKADLKLHIMGHTGERPHK